MSRMKAAALLCLAVVVATLASPALIGTEDIELRDLDVTGWDCVNQSEGTAQGQDGIERNRMKNRWPVDLSLLTVESLDTAEFLKKVREYDSRVRGEHRSQLTAARRDQLDSYENPSDHPPQTSDPTPIVCEITPRTERAIYCDNMRIQSVAAFFRLLDMSCQPTGNKARKIRVTGYLLWDDEHNGSADVGSTIEHIGSNGFHHPWRSTAWEIHPVMKIEVIH